MSQICAHLPTSCIGYILSLSDLLAKEFSHNFKLFCSQNNLTLSDALLKDVYHIVIRQLKKGILSELDTMCSTKRINLVPRSTTGKSHSISCDLSSLSKTFQCPGDETAEGEGSSEGSEVELDESPFLYKKFFGRLSLRKVTKGE